MQKTEIRKEVKERVIAGLDRSELVLLEFSIAETTDLEWEHEREFEYQGDMYDVVEKESTQDSVFYWCWPDTEETELNKHLDALLVNALGHPVNNEQRGLVIDFYKKLVFTINDAPFGRIASYALAPFANVIVFKNREKSPPTPPPKLI